MTSEETKDDSVALRLLVFHMHSAGYTQNEIAAYVERSKTTINAMLKPLQRRKGKDAK
jgi:transposase